MDIGSFAQSCANAYREIGERHGWRKGRNSSRGYDALTLPNGAWDDTPYDRYLLVVHHHASSAATQLDSCGGCYSVRSASAVVTLARAVFVESSKVAWLLEDDVPWARRAARAHLELLANLDTQMRRLPKRLDSGYPNFRRKQWKVHREQLRDNVIEVLFGKRAISRDRDDDMTMAGEVLLTSTQLEEDFAELISVNGLDSLRGSAYVVAPDVLIDPLLPVEVRLDVALVVDDAVVQQSLVIAIEAWLAALDAWARYNGWETTTIDALGHQLPRLLGHSC